MQLPMSESLAAKLRQAGLITAEDLGSPSYYKLLDRLGYTFGSKSTDEQVKDICVYLEEARNLTDDDIREWLPYLIQQSLQLKRS